MHRIFFAGLLAAGLLVAAAAAQARDTVYKLKIDEVLRNPESKAKLGDDVALYFGDRKPTNVAQNFGDHVTNNKTNSFGKPDEEACRWAMLSALLELQERAHQQGGNAVINIVSYYKKTTYSSQTEYDCHAGALLAGVALKGTVVKLKEVSGRRGRGGTRSLP